MYATGDLNGALPGPAVAAALADQIGSQSPDLVMFGMTYEARDVLGRLSVKLDRRCSRTSSTSRSTASSVRCTTAIFGGNTLVTTGFSGGGPALAAFRPKSFAAEEGGAAAGEVVSVTLPDVGAAGAGDACSPATSKSPRAPSSTRRTSSCQVDAASARPATTT